MIKVFTIENDVVKPDPSLDVIPVFKKLKEKTGKEYLNCLSYIYHMVTPTSPYFNMDKDSRSKTLENEFLSNIKQTDDLKLTIQNCMNKIQVDFKSQNYIMLQSAQKGVRKITDYIESIELDDTNIAAFVRAMEKLPTITETLKTAEKALKEEQDEGNIRGGGTINKRERRPSNR